MIFRVEVDIHWWKKELIYFAFEGKTPLITQQGDRHILNHDLAVKSDSNMEIMIIWKPWHRTDFPKGYFKTKGT